MSGMTLSYNYRISEVEDIFNKPFNHQSFSDRAKLVIHLAYGTFEDTKELRSVRADLFDGFVDNFLDFFTGDKTKGEVIEWLEDCCEFLGEGLPRENIREYWKK